MKSKILLVAATKEEIADVDFSRLAGSRFEVDLLVTGIGVAATVFHLTEKLLSSNCKYALVINAGIAGAFDRDLMIGGAYIVDTDRFADLGEFSSDGMLPIESLPIMKWADLPDDGCLKPGFDAGRISCFKKVSAVTSDTVTTDASRIVLLKKSFQPALETMEGAAFYYVCWKQGIPSLQLRAVSNYIGPREKASWDIPLAVKKLEEALYNLFDELHEYS